MATAQKEQGRRRQPSKTVKGRPSKAATPEVDEQPQGNGDGPTLMGQPDGPVDEEASVEISTVDGEEPKQDGPLPPDQVPVDGAMVIRKMTEDGVKYDIQMLGSMPPETAPTLFEKGEEIARERLGLKPRGRS
jgi:hypothetical protein